MRLLKAGSRILFSRIWQVLANAVAVLVIAKTLGPTGQGYFSLTVAVAMLLGAALGGGMGLAAVPPLRRKQVPIVRMLTAQLFWAALMGVVMAVLAALVGGGRAAEVLASRLGWESGMGWLVACAGLGLLTFDIFAYDLLARGRLVVGAAVNGYRASAYLLLIGALGLMGQLTLGRAIGVFALSQAGGAVAMLVILIREIRHPRNENHGTGDESVPGVGEKDFQLHDRSLFGLIAYNMRHGWVGQISAVAYFLLLRLDQGLLEYFRGAAEVGIYSLAVYMGEMLWLLPGALTPILVHTSATSATDPDRDRTALRAVQLGILITFAVAVPLYLLAEPLLGFLAGGQYQASGAALKALLPGIVVFAPGAVLAGDFIGRGKPHWNTQASVLTVVVNIAVGLWFIPRYGAVGAAYASSIAYFCGSVVMVLRFRQVTGLSIFNGPRGS
ncbi:MAG: polysaccharide biosynthesis C-terminal domain-containing protein [Gemmatimonadales bacterium]|nr:polysaccharide biosynthesis C-terminal domain-containing protein [Gemmatimonadales bacterium]